MRNWQRPAMEFHKAANPQALPFFNPPRADEPEEHVRARFAHLERNIERGRFLVEFGNKQFKPFLEALEIQRGEFLRPYSSDPGSHLAELKAQFAAGRLPPRRADWVDIPPPGATDSNSFKTLRERGLDFKREMLDNISREEIRGGFAKMFDSVRKSEGIGCMVANPLALGAALGPFGGLASGLLASPKPDAGLPTSNQTPAHLIELANKLNPAKEFQNRLADLDKVRDLGLVSKDQFSKGRGDLVREFADKMGLGGEVHLPSAAMVGSAEDAKLLQNFRAGGQEKESVENWLRMIYLLLERAERERVNEAVRGAAAAIANF